MKTTYQIIPVGDGPIVNGEVHWPREPGYELIRALVEPLLGERGDPMEHVSVLLRGGARDMFVSEYGRMWGKELPFNQRATEHYRRSWLERHPEDNPRSLNYIAGTAVLFERRVWF